MERDANLDKYRAIVMAYIVCIIHLIYWAGFCSEPDRSFLLFEMPVIFFISGASYRLSTPKSYTSFVKGRIRRIIIPYYIWLLLSLPLSIILLQFGRWGIDAGLTEGMSNSELMDSGIRKIVLFHRSQGLIPFDNHVWFIVPFFLIMLLAPIVSRLINNQRDMVFCIVLFLLLVFVGDFLYHEMLIHNKVVELINYVFAYLPFFIIGFAYKKAKLTPWHILLAILLIFISVWAMRNGVYPDSVQLNKFPPTCCFVIYNFGVLLLLIYLFDHIRIPDWKWLEIYNKRGFTIYIYQNWTMAFFYYLILVPVREIHIIPDWTLFLISLLFLFYLNMFLSKYTYKLEQFIISKIWK